MLLLLQGKSGTELRGAAVPYNFDLCQTHAVKFEELLKVRLTLTELRTALLKFKKCVKVREPELLAEPRAEQPC